MLNSTSSGKSGKPKRRSTWNEDVPVVLRDHIEGLIAKVDSMDYGYSIKGGLTPDEQKMRNKALISVFYLTGRRISEIVGRIFRYDDGRVDVWRGVFIHDFSVEHLDGEPFLRMRYRVLKRGTQKTSLKVVMSYCDINLQDPLTEHIRQWLLHLGKHHRGKVFNLTRQRALTIMTELDPDVWLHWFRHQRVSHVASVMNPYQLGEWGRFARLETSLHYVHENPSRLVKKVEEADRLWSQKSG